MRTSIILLVAWICVQCISARADPDLPASLTKQRVTFSSHDLTLVGFLFKPDGPGPFPAIVWNHGSEKGPGKGPQFDTVAKVFVPAGYVVFAPMRRGHGESQGAYIVDVVDSVRRARGADAANRESVHLMESEQLDDQLAGLAYLKTLPYVDTSRLVVAGCSFGGIETLLAAERDVGYKAAIAISPGALSWRHDPELQRRLVQGVRNINIPVFLLQPAKDASLEPSRVLGDEFRRLGKPFSGKIYPAVGPEDEQRHCFGGAKGMHVWGQDALEFVSRALNAQQTRAKALHQDIAQSRAGHAEVDEEEEGARGDKGVHGTAPVGDAQAMRAEKSCLSEPGSIGLSR